MPGSHPKKATTVQRLPFISASEKCLPDTYVGQLTNKGSSNSYRKFLRPSQRLFLYCDFLPLCSSRKALCHLHSIQPLFRNTMSSEADNLSMSPSSSATLTSTMLVTEMATAQASTTTALVASVATATNSATEPIPAVVVCTTVTTFPPLLEFMEPLINCMHGLPQLSLLMLKRASILYTLLSTDHNIARRVQAQFTISNYRRQSNLRLRIHKHTIIHPVASVGNAGYQSLVTDVIIVAVISVYLYHCLC